ncbi:hypothetical protein HK102_007604, partial [Quaeritorhiza haematococci]
MASSTFARVLWFWLETIPLAFVNLALYHVSPRFLQPLYNGIVVHAYHDYAVAISLSLGFLGGLYFLSSSSNALSKGKGGRSGAFAVAGHEYLKLSALFFAAAPQVLLLLFPFSRNWGPLVGPVVTQGLVTYPIHFLSGLCLADWALRTPWWFPIFLAAPTLYTLWALRSTLDALWTSYFTSCESFAVLGLLLAVWTVGVSMTSFATDRASVSEQVDVGSDGKGAKKGVRVKRVQQQQATRKKAALVSKLDVVVYLLVALFVSYTYTSTPQCAKGIPDYRQVPSPYTILARQESNTGIVSVVEDSSRYGGVRVLRCDHSLIGGIYPKYNNDSIFGGFYFMDFVRFITRPAREGVKKRVLNIGLGVGIATTALMENNYADVDVIEIDPVVYKYAREHFNMPEPASVHITDGRKFLDDLVVDLEEKGSEEGVYDFVIHDVFTNGYVPPGLFSVESLQAVRRVMVEGGILGLNYVGMINSTSTIAVAYTLLEVFPYLVCFSDSTLDEDRDEKLQNMVFFASTKPITFHLPPLNTLKTKSNVYLQMLQSFPKSMLDMHTLWGVPRHVFAGAFRGYPAPSKG